MEQKKEVGETISIFENSLWIQHLVAYHHCCITWSILQA